MKVGKQKEKNKTQKVDKMRPIQSKKYIQKFL